MRDFPRGTGQEERFGDDGSARYPTPWAEGPGGWLDRVPAGRRRHGATPTALPHAVGSRRAEPSVPGLGGRLTPVPGRSAAPTSYDDSPPYALLRAAAEFLTLRHTEERLGDPARRIAAARAEIAETGTYRHTTEELAFGARVAWRNANRCIGRLYWRSLCVRDRRDVRTAEDVAEASADHLREAAGEGRIRALITVFA